MVSSKSGSKAGVAPKIAILMAFAALFAFVAGCGSSDDSSSSGDTQASTEGSSAAGGSIAEAEKLVSEYSKSNQTIGVDVPLKQKPQGATFAFLPAAGEASEKFEADGWNEAGEKLGVGTEVIPQGATPASTASAWNQAVNQTPPFTGIWYGGTPPSTVSAQVKALNSKDVSIIGFNSNLENEAGGGTSYPGVDFDIAPNEWAEVIGQIQAAWITTDSQADAKVLYVNIKAYPGLVLSEEAFNDELSNLCPDCSSSSMPVQPTEIGTKVPEKVVAELQRDPDINYVVFGFGDMALGVPQALKSGGLNEKAKVVTQTGGPQNIEYIENGEQAMDVALNLEEAGWKAIDVLARLANGESTDPANVLIPLVIVTPESLENGDVKLDTTGQVFTAPNYKEEYEALWAGK